MIASKMLVYRPRNGAAISTAVESMTLGSEVDA
jgi:hypothetical protein